MKKLFVAATALFATLAASAQNTQTAALEAAAALSAAEDAPEKVEKPTYWTHTAIMNLNFGQTYLSQWVAGGYNNVSLAGNVDVTAQYAKDKLKGTHHVQLDYGFLYSADKPILQKNKDRIYLESVWSYDSFIKNLAYSASFDFKTQFYNNYDYKTPATQTNLETGEVIEPSVADWKNARVLKSGFMTPAYINLGIGLLWTPAPWLSVNFAPVSGGAVLVNIRDLRYTYGMDLTKDGQGTYGGNDKTAKQAAHAAQDYDAFRSSRFELGTQLKVDAGWVINDKFSYTTQFTLFYNYITPKVEPRITWDNKIFWKMRRFFALTVSTNLIYDPLVIVRDADKDGVKDSKGVQFKEFLEFGFTYTFSRQR